MKEPWRNFSRTTAWTARLGLAALLLAAGCPDRRQAEDGGALGPAGQEQAAAGQTSPKSEPAGDQPQAADTQQAEDQMQQQASGQEDLPPPQETSGEVGKVIIRATGRAKRSADISLSREAAAERARAELLKILKETGYLDADSDRLQGATIERFYQRGRYLYAVAAIEVGTVVNESGTPASKSSEEHGVQRQEPHGGTK